MLRLFGMELAKYPNTNADRKLVNLTERKNITSVIFSGKHNPLAIRITLLKNLPTGINLVRRGSNNKQHTFQGWDGFPEANDFVENLRIKCMNNDCNLAWIW